MKKPPRTHLFYRYIQNPIQNNGEHRYSLRYAIASKNGTVELRKIDYMIENGGAQYSNSSRPLENKNSNGIEELMAFEKEWRSKGYTPCIKDEDLLPHIRSYRLTTNFFKAEHYGGQLADDIFHGGTKSPTRLIKKISPSLRKPKR